MVLTLCRVLYQGDLEDCFGEKARYFQVHFFNTHQEDWEKIYDKYYLPYNEEVEAIHKSELEKIADKDELVDNPNPTSVSSPSLLTTYAGLLIDNASYDESEPPSEEEFLRLQQELIENNIIPPPTIPIPPPTNPLPSTNVDQKEENEEPAQKKQKTN